MTHGRCVGALVALGFLCGCPPRDPDYPEYARRMLETSAQRSSAAFILQCDPPDATVLVDGVAQGLCTDFAGHPRGLALGSGAHEVIFRLNGFWDEVRYVEPNGVRGQLSVKLRPQGP